MSANTNHDQCRDDRRETAPGPGIALDVPVGIFLTDSAGNCLFVNRRWCELAGMTPEQAEGTGWIAALHADDRERVAREWYAAAESGAEFTSEYRFQTPAGRVTWLQGRAAPLRDESGILTGFTGALTDITDRKRAEDEAHAARAQLQYITDTMPSFVAHCSRDRRFIWVNGHFAERFGMAPEQIAGRPIADVLGAEAYALICPYVERALQGQTISYEAELPYRGVGKIWVQAIYAPTYNAAGDVSGWIAAVTDISARKAAEQALRETEQRFARFMQHLPGLAWIKDLEGRYVYANEAAEQAFGLPREQLYGRTDDEVFPLQTAAEFRRNDLRALTPGSGVQTVEQLEHKDGVVHHSLVSKFPIPGKEGEPALIGGMAIDITERLRAEEALRQSERRFRVALASGAVTAFEQDLALRYTWVYPQDPAFPEQNIGRTDLELLPDDRGEALMQLKRQVIESKCGTRRTVKVVLPAGARYYDLLVEPRYDETGAVLGVGGAALDITAQKLVEESLKDADRRKDEFLATLAHELRNPLAPIANSVQLLRLTGSADSEAQAARDIIDRQVRQLTRLVDDLLDVSRVSQGKIRLRRKLLDLAGVIEQALETSRPLIEATGHELAVLLPETPLVVEGDLTRLAQVIGNLLNNAAKYTESCGRITVEATRRGGRAQIAVRDTGIGIPADMLVRIFELFAQVETGIDRAQGGLGIGLTLVKSLVELHGGSVEARSAGPGRGSEFLVWLPLASTSGHDRPVTQIGPGDDEPAGPRWRILVVDDNVDSAITLARLLRRVGNEVQTAHDGPSALEAAAQFQPNLMLIDLGMPGMTGFELARRIREQPELAEARLVALTGWGQPEDRVRTRQAGFDQHLVKPVDFAVLQLLLSQWAEAKSLEG